MVDSACLDSAVSNSGPDSSYLRRHDTWFFLVWALWLSLEYFVFGVNSYVRLHNNADLILSRLLALRQNLHEGFFGNWQPQWGMGADRASYPATYNISALFFLIFPGWLGYPALMVAQRWIAGLFTFKLLRGQCRVAELAAIWGAMWYAMFSQSTLNRGWTGFTIYEGFGLAGIPLFLYLLGKIGNNNRRDIAIVCGAGGFWAVAAHISYSFFMVPLSALWFLCIDPKRSKRFWLLFAICILISIVVALPLNWPTLLLASDSVRVKYRLNAVFGGPIDSILGIVNPFLDNLIPCCFIAVGIILTKLKKSRFTAAFAGIMAFSLAATFYGVVTGLSQSTTLQAFGGDRARYCVPFLLGVGATLIIDLLNQKIIMLKDATSNRSSWFYLGNGIALFAIAVIGWQSIVIKTRTGRDMLNGQNVKNYYANPVIRELQQLNSGKPPFRVATIAVGDNVLPLLPPGAAWAYGLETADNSLVLTPDRNRLYWEKVLGPEVSRNHEIFNWVDSYGQQLNLFYPDATSAPANLDDNYNVDLLSLANVRYIISPIPISSAHIRPVQSAYLKQQFQTAKLNRPHRLLEMIKGRYEGMPTYVYENVDFFPRVFWVSRVTALSSDAEVLDAISKAPRSELRSTAFLHGKTGEPASVDLLDTSRTLAVTKYTADEITISFSNGSRSFLVISNSYSKFWTAYCGNAIADIVPTDHALQGIMIPGECEKLTLSYRRPGI